MPDMGSLKQDLDHLRTLRGDTITVQERGQQFEPWLTKLLASQEPRTRYRAKGEEIDGSFLHHNRPYLLEAKWHRDPLPASAIYAFKGKVDGKLAGTLGVFISMSGYAKDAVDALRIGKALNIILFDVDDVDSAIEHGFAKVLDFKLRHAAEQGEVMVPYVERRLGGPSILFVVETSDDAMTLLRLAVALRRMDQRVSIPEIKISQGPIGLPTVASALSEATDGKVVVVAKAEPYAEHQAAIEQLTGDANRIKMIIANPSIEAWAEAIKPEGAKSLAHKGLEPRIGDADLKALAQAHAGFRSFAELLGVHL